MFEFILFSSQNKSEWQRQRTGACSVSNILNWVIHERDHFRQRVQRRSLQLWRELESSQKVQIVNEYIERGSTLFCCRLHYFIFLRFTLKTLRDLGFGKSASEESVLLESKCLGVFFTSENSYIQEILIILIDRKLGYTVGWVPFRKRNYYPFYWPITRTLGTKCCEKTKKNVLKVLTNEKRGGLKVVIFDRSSIKLFSLWFSNKSMQAPSCERPKTTQRSLFFPFAINNCFPASDEKLLAVFELILGDFLQL